MEKKRKIKNDIILIAAVVLIAAIVFTLFIVFRKAGKTVVVTVNNEVFGEYPLSQDRTVEIKTDTGRNLLVIRDGKADITEASCPDLICAKHHAVSSVGEQIVCLPNKVVVSIE